MKTKFDASFARTDTERRARHGMPWTDKELTSLQDMFIAAMNLEHICNNLQRPADGVLNKLCYLNLIKRDPVNYCYWNVVDPISTTPRAPSHQPPNTKEEPTMSKNLIESKVFVNGVDATSMSDTEIFSLLAKTEVEIAKLEAIKTPSKKLGDAIAKLKTDVAKLAEYVDSRE